jgi:NAD(P)-dependent dehydrogenase (short-subunit alcohol dehydrogenase family)
MAEFDNLTGVVTGGATGIEPATALPLASFGARVFCFDRDPGDVPEPLLGLDPATAPAAVVSVADALGGIEICVNNACLGAQCGVADNPVADWHRVLDLNVVGMVRVIRAGLPYLRKSRHGAIANTCSIAAHAGLPNRALYSASEEAVQALMAADQLADGIRVNCVNPGTVDTPWVRRLLAAADDPNAELRVMCAPAHRPAGERGPGRLPCQPIRQLHYRDRARRRRWIAGPPVPSTRIAVLRQLGHRSRLKSSARPMLSADPTHRLH